MASTTWYRRPQLPKWTTCLMAEEKSKEILYEVTLREAFFYFAFLVIATIATIGMTYPEMYYLTRAIQQQFLEQEFSTVNEVEINFHDIRTAADFWFYVENVLIDKFYWNYWYDNDDPVEGTEDDDKKILYENKLIGVARLRQLKVRNNSCEIHEHFRRMFAACYGPYSSQAEDTESFGPEEETAWVYHSQQLTGNAPYWGQVATYSGGGFYQDLSTEMNETKDMLSQLKNNLWITRGTRAILIDFTVYNANLNLFCIAKVIFEFPPTGGVLPSSSIHSVHLIRYITPKDYFVLGMEILFYCYIVYYVAEEIREMMYFKWRYFKFFWNYIDLTIIVFTFVSVVANIVRAKLVTGIQDELEKIDEYANFEHMRIWQMAYNNLMAITLFFIYIKVFKYLRINKTMGQLNNTLRKCALDILGFSVMFFIIFFAFAELGYLLFGTQVEGFSSFGVAMFTLLRTILGDFDYTKIESANRVLAPIYFLSYIFFVFFVLLNMFLAIINDTYTDVKTEMSIAPDEIQLSQFLKRGFYNLMRRLNCRYFMKQERVHENEYNVTIEEIRGALKRCGFSDLEIQMFFNRYNIDPTAQVNEYDINKLMANLEKPLQRPKQADDDGGKPASTPTVTITDFAAQQERLDQVERSIAELMYRVDALLKKLDTLENVRKSTRR